jgi:hypothetical protein
MMHLEDGVEFARKMTSKGTRVSDKQYAAAT